MKKVKQLLHKGRQLLYKFKNKTDSLSYYYVLV